MNFLGIIPARYSSVRFPGKPLALLGNKPVIQWVLERAGKAMENVYVATDDERIFQAVKKFGAKAVMTSGKHPSGTDRCAEALNIISLETGTHFDCVINVQGDEPFISPLQIQALINCFQDAKTDIATLAKKITSREEISDPNKPKVVFDKSNFALYFSRSPIPYIRNAGTDITTGSHNIFRHIGIYGYRSDVLKELSHLKPSPLELAESLEQLRWLQNGYKIKVSLTDLDNLGIDTPEDLIEAERRVAGHS